jgi:purine nucleosidase
MNAPAPAPIHIWLDTDPGFDDYMAWALLEADRRFVVDGVGVVAGNAPLERTLSNALRIKALHGLSTPVHAGCDRPLAQAQVTAQDVLGENAMKSVGRKLPRAEAPLTPGHAVDALIAHVRAHPHEVVLLAVGPLTNVATAFANAPELPSLLKRLVIMGGSTDRGNTNAVAEFNIAADPEAAQQVFDAGIEVPMFGLNVCRQVEVGPEHVALLRADGGETALLFADLLQAYCELIKGRNRMAVYDPTPVAWLANPAWFTLEPARVDIELVGRHTRGMTVCEFRVPRRAQPNALVAMQADGVAVMDWAMQTLRGFLARSSGSRSD